jgi:hypothetical protein
MATPERIEPSQRFAAAAEAERRRLRRTLDRAVREAEALRRRLEAVEREAARVRQQLLLIESVPAPRNAGAPRPAQEARAGAEPRNGHLSGAAIRIVAVRLLADSELGGRPIHYQDWLALLRERGFDVAGRNPGATFLTQITRSPVVQRAEDAGAYALDLDAPTRLRERLAVLNGELAALTNGQQTIEAIASARERRKELVAEIARVERALEEAVESLPAEPD